MHVWIARRLLKPSWTLWSWLTWMLINDAVTLKANHDFISTTFFMGRRYTKQLSCLHTPLELNTLKILSLISTRMVWLLKRMELQNVYQLILYHSQFQSIYIYNLFQILLQSIPFPYQEECQGYLVIKKCFSFHLACQNSTFTGSMRNVAEEKEKFLLAIGNLRCYGTSCYHTFLQWNLQQMCETCQFNTVKITRLCNLPDSQKAQSLHDTERHLDLAK